MSSFDVERYRREKFQRLEREIKALRAHRDRLERLLALALRVATGKTETAPMALLAVLEKIDKRVHEEFDWVAWAREVAARTEGIERSPGALAALENARRAVEDDPVRLGFGETAP